jgi:hypothetical protein
MIGSGRKKGKYMRFRSIVATLCLLLMTCFAMATADAKSAISDAEVRSYMKQMEGATKSRNYDKVVSMMSPKIKIKWDINGKEIELDRTKYHQNAKLNPNPYKTYEYRSEINSVKLEKTRAIVRYMAYEKATGKQGTINMKMKQVAVLERQNGRLMMTYLAGRGELGKE